MEEKRIICRDCKKEFIFSVGEQGFYKEKNLSDPIRCKDCRKKKRENIKEVKQEKTEEEIKDDFEKMLERFKANTILFEQELNKRNNKRNK